MIFITLPAYNEGPAIAKLIRGIALTASEFLPGLEFTVVVVDDGSTDETAATTQKTFRELEAAGSQVAFLMLSHQQNRGLAEAIKTGLFFCADKSSERDVILTMDSDNSHAPGLFPHLVRKIYEGYDVVIASRYLSGARVVGLSLHRRLLSLAAGIVFRALFPIPGVRDYTCGYRAYRAELLKKVISDNPNFISEHGFTVMVDILLKLRHLKHPVLMTEVPLLLRYDQKESDSKMNVRRTVAQSLSLVFRRRLGRP